MIDGPNEYTYVRQNPWTKFDPEGLASDDVTAAGVVPTRDKHHISPVCTWDRNGIGKNAQLELDKTRIGVADVDHGSSAHGQYNQRVDKITKDYIEKWKAKGGADPLNLSQKDAKEFADGLINEIKNTTDPYVRGFNDQVAAGADQDALKLWGREYKARVWAGTVDDVWFSKWGTKFFTKGGKLLAASADVLEKVRKGLPVIGTVLAIGMTAAEAKQEYDDGEDMSEIARTQYYRNVSLTGQTPEELNASEEANSECVINYLKHGKYETDAQYKKEHPEQDDFNP